MSGLWSSNDVSVWREHLAQIGKRLQALENVKLEKLERHVTFSARHHSETHAMCGDEAPKSTFCPYSQACAGGSLMSSQRP